MAAIAAVVCFAIALIFRLAGFHSGHLDETTFMLAGMLCLALAAVPAWPWRK